MRSIVADQFYRGMNRLDWLYALMLESAFDFSGDELTQEVANQIGFVSLSRHDLGDLIPPCGVLVTTDFVIVLCGATQSVYHWLGNVLGSAAVETGMAHGRLSLYFSTVAQAHYSAVHAEVIAWLSGRRLVLIGFSLGAASATILKDTFKRQDSIDSAVVAGASPRCGLQDFVTGFPTDNFSRFQFNLDPVPGLPPTIWAGLGVHNGWNPIAPFVVYQHIQPGYTLYFPDKIQAGDDIPSLSWIASSFDLDKYANYHDPSLYAQIIRSGLPYPLQDGQEGYAKASDLDRLASSVFSWVNWPWFPWQPKGGPTMASLVQVAVYIRDTNGIKGYQEIYYYNSNDPQAIFQAFFLPSFNASLAPRAKFLSRSCEIYAFRASAVSPSPKQSLLQKFDVPIPGGVSAEEEELDNCLTFFLYNGTRSFKRQIHYGGISSAWINSDKLTPAGMANIPNIDAWFAALRGKGTLCIKAPTYETTTAFSGIQKTAVGDNAILELDSAITVAGGRIGNISKIRSFPLLRGDWLLADTGGIASNRVEVLHTEKLAPPPNTPGLLRVIDPASSGSFATLVAQVFNGASIRKRGRAPFSPRGRRSKVLSHR